jgi:molybdopterin/thiamine biosynthesis adenylyltransferase
VVAYELAAAGVGSLVLAHGGDIKPSDLNRQLVMTHDALGTSRVASAERRLKELNPRLEIIAEAENVSTHNIDRLLERVDVVVDAAPLFDERFAMNDAAMARGIPVVDCAMYEMQATITTMVPGVTPCLRCLVPEAPELWKRQFPVFGAVSGTVGCIGAMEATKLISGLGDPLLGRMWQFDLRSMRFSELQIERDPDCPVCSGIHPPE